MPRTPNRAVPRLVVSALTAIGLVVSAQSLVGTPPHGLTTDLPVMTALSGGPAHEDPLPEGVSLDDPTGTAALYARAGLDRADAEEILSAGAAAPAGRPSTASLGAHVVPSCSGTGSDGKRVQPLYVREATAPSRYGAVLPLLLNEVANVDDVFAVSAAKTGGVRRVRWVHDACVPVLPEVVVPAGALASFGATINALQAQGLSDPSRKYLVFADANVLCGIGTLYSDARPSGNLNDARTAYSRVDAPCWSGSMSVAAHELTHNLGGVLPGAPHQTVNGHCWDEADLMCYSDGSGVAMQTLCADAGQGQLLDCGNDDYFSTAPAAGSWLAQSWNTASSGFLDTTVSDPTLTPPPPTTGPAPVAPAPTVEPRSRRTKVEGHWQGKRRRVTGELRLAGQQVRVVNEVLTLQRRDSGRWRNVGRDTTDRSGRVSERDRPRRGAVYRWVFDGNDQLQGSHSDRIRVRR